MTPRKQFDIVFVRPYCVFVEKSNYTFTEAEVDVGLISVEHAARINARVE